MKRLQKAKIAGFKYTILNKIAQHILFISCALLRIPKMESKGKTVLMNHHIDNFRRYCKADKIVMLEKLTF